MRRYRIDDLKGKKVLLAASTGGHLSQLVRLAPALGVDPQGPWLTFDTAQSRTLLAGRDVHTVPYIRPRDWKSTIGGALRAWSLVGQADAVVSTGAAIALSVLPQALLRRKKVVYIESISRTQGPSMSGRILARLPRVGLYTQHHSWADDAWRPGPSVLAQYQVASTGTAPVRSMLVTLGTIEPYRFDRLVDLVQGYLERNPRTEVVWQLGCTTREDLPGRVESMLDADELTRLMEESDVVIAHSGVGIAMSILDAGKMPVLLDRRASLDEHVDDHQRQIFDYLTERGLARDAAEALASGDLESVAGSVVSPSSAATTSWKEPARPLRVMQVGPDPSSVGGMGAVVATLDHHAILAGNDVDLRTVDSGGGRGRSGYHRFAGALTAVAWEEFDVLHLHVATAGSTLRKAVLALLARARRRPYVIHLHGGMYRDWYTGLRPAARRAVHRFFSRASAVVTLGPTWSQWATEALGLPEQRIAEVFNGVPEIERSPDVERADQLLYVGTLGQAKGVHDLCAVAGDLLTREEHSHWTIAVLGHSPDPTVSAALVELRERIGDRLITPGTVVGADRDVHYARSRILVLPSYAEGLPLVMLEAMSAELVAVISDVGAVADVLRDGENGRLVTPGDREQLTQVLHELMTDRDLAGRLARGGRHTYEQKATAQQMLTTIAQVWAEAALEAGPDRQSCGEREQKETSWTSRLSA